MMGSTGVPCNASDYCKRDHRRGGKHGDPAARLPRSPRTSQAVRGDLRKGCLQFGLLSLCPSVARFMKHTRHLSADRSLDFSFPSTLGALLQMPLHLDAQRRVQLAIEEGEQVFTEFATIHCRT